MFKENKLAAINYWFTGCKACLEEMPVLEKLSQDLKEKGVELVGVCVEDLDQEGLDKAKELLAFKGVTYRNITVDHSEEADKYLNKIMAFPPTIFVDQEGNIVGEETVGYLDESSLDDFMAKVDKALEEKEAK